MITLLQLTSQSPLTTGIIIALVGGIGILVQWITFAVMLKRWKNEEDQLKIQRALDGERLIKRICQEFTSSVEYTAAKEKRMKEIAEWEISNAFSRRAESFVDAKEYRADRRHIKESVDKVEKQIESIGITLGEMNSKLNQMIWISNKHNITSKDDDDTTRRRG